MKYQLCPKCQGSGTTYSPCSSSHLKCGICGGKGLITEHETELKLYSVTVSLDDWNMNGIKYPCGPYFVVASSYDDAERKLKAKYPKVNVTMITTSDSHIV